MRGFLYGMLMREHLRPQRIMGWLAVIVVVLLMATAFKNFDGAGSLRYSTISSILVYKLLALSAAIFATSVVAQEVEQKTIVYLVTHPIPRGDLILMRTLAAATMVALVSICAAVGISLITEGSAFLSNGYMWKDIPAILIGSLAYCALFVFFTLVTRKAMIINLIYAFAWESAMPSIGGSISVISIARYLQEISQRPKVAQTNALPMQMSEPTFFNQWQSWLILSLFTAGCLVLNMWWFRRFEYTPKEDSE